MEGIHESMGGMGNSPPPFLSKTYDMVDDPSTDAVVSWSKNNNSFVVRNVPEFSRDILPKYFKHNNFSSFVRQLNTYGFRKVDPDSWEFANEGFLRGHKHLLKNISRRKPSQVQVNQQSSQVKATSVGSCVEVGKFGIEEEVERLKRDKNVLMQELVRLRQQQQATDHQLQSVGQRVHVMEQRQQQMMSFLAKAMQSPGFMAQLVHQQNDSNRRISGGINKKRRLPSQDEENIAGQFGATMPDGQIVSYQPLMNEAAKAMLRQILKINSSSRLESKLSSANGFLANNLHPPSNTSDAGSMTNRISGVTLSEVLSTSSQSILASESGRLFNLPTTAVSEIQANPGMVPGGSEITSFQESNGLTSQAAVVLPEFPQGEGMVPQNKFGSTDNKVSENGGIESMDAMPGFVDNTLPIVTDEFSSDPDDDILFDENPKLPGINDVFWEQFLSASPLIGDMDEINSSSLESAVRKEQDLQTGRESEWDKGKQMNCLTHQMGLLASGSKSG